MADPKQRSSSRSGLTVGLLVLGGGLLLLSGSLQWASATASVAGGSVPLDGATCLPLARGLGLLALAGAGGVAATRGVWRALLGGVLALAAIVGIVAFAGVVSSGLASAADTLPVGLDGRAPTIEPTSLTGPLLAAMGLAAMLAGGAVALVTARRSAGLGSRFERKPDREPTPIEPGAPADSAALWAALDRGDDPT